MCCCLLNCVSGTSNKTIKALQAFQAVIGAQTLNNGVRILSLKLCFLFVLWGTYWFKETHVFLWMAVVSVRKTHGQRF